MTDKALIELAAKAAGITGTWHRSGYIAYSGWHGSVFDPINDDGDALRLMVYLKLCIEIGPCSVEVSQMANKEQRDNDERGNLLTIETYVGNASIGKSARLAITRSAAQIGKEME